MIIPSELEEFFFSSFFSEKYLDLVDCKSSAKSKWIKKKKERKKKTFISLFVCFCAFVQTDGNRMKNLYFVQSSSERITDRKSVSERERESQEKALHSHRERERQRENEVGVGDWNEPILFSIHLRLHRTQSQFVLFGYIYCEWHELRNVLHSKSATCLVVRLSQAAAHTRAHGE